MFLLPCAANHQHMKRFWIFLVVIAPLFSIAQQYTADWASIDKRHTPNWYGNAKFGIFIHWGVYSVPAWATDSYADGFGSNYAEWYWQRLNATNLKIHKDFTAFHEKVYGKNFDYHDFAKQFKAEMFKPELWASIIKKSGAKYVVLTSKHHDGFALWPAPGTDNWNATVTGPHRDLLGDLSKSVRDSGLRMGYYYSLCEWYHPLYKADVAKYVSSYMLPQIKDLVTKYSPDVLWTDGEWEQSSETWKAKEIISWLYNEPSVKDKIVINDRWGNDTKGLHGSFNTSEYGHGNKNTQKPWEECRGIGQSFGYNRNENLSDYASSKELVHELIKVVSSGGNLLLNIGPAADGNIPVIMQQRLKEIGDWLSVNGEAIYNTTVWEKSSIQKDSSLFFTKKEKSIFAIATKWKNKLIVNTNGEMPKSVALLGFEKKLKFRQKGKNLEIFMPNLLPDRNPGNIAWVAKMQF